MPVVRASTSSSASSSSRPAASYSFQGQRLPPARAAAPPMPAPTAAAATSQKGTDRRAHDQIGTLLVQCPDAKGVVASVAQLLFGFNSDQFTDETTAVPRFFQRTEFDFSEISVGAANLPVLERAIDDLAARYNMEYRI
ncbi:hypothetical protein MNEG_16236, partial [Monoraphidium neglectum]